MSRTVRRFSSLSIALSCVLAFGLLPSWAKDKDAPDYPQSGRVLSSSSKGMHSYQVETDSRIYLLLCEEVKGVRVDLPECLVDDKPIAAGDTVKLRVDGDWAYMPVADGEDKLRILATELKVIPPAPAASDNPKASIPGAERGMVIGTGMHDIGQKQMAWSTNPSPLGRLGFGGSAPASGLAMASPGAPVIATGPVMAVPVTGGAPVMVMPTGPTGGGVTTGVPVTGGAPVTAVATGPVMGIPIGGARRGAFRPGGPAMDGEGPTWVHTLRVQSGKNIYQLECSATPCEVDATQIELGDTLVIRVDKNWAHVSFSTDRHGKEQKIRILGDSDKDATPDAKTSDTKAPDPKPSESK